MVVGMGDGVGMKIVGARIAIGRVGVISEAEGVALNDKLLSCFIVKFRVIVFP